MSDSISRKNNLPVLAFDWGDTLMKMFDYPGAMVNWPRVEAVEGAQGALAALSGLYRLVVATNAADSTPQQVCAALERVGLAEYFEGVYTTSVLGARKPQPAFFEALETELHVQQGQCMMVGDDYSTDVLGAKRAGWRAVWLNHTGKACPACTPLHDIEITSLADLPTRLAGPPLPDLPTCHMWLLGQGASQSLIQHVQVVAATAYQLAVWLRRNGIDVNPVLAHRGGMLHDVAKLSTRHEEGIHHGEKGARVLEALGEPVLAQIARRHMLFSFMENKDYPETWEERLVYYSDKLAEGSRLVPYEERLTALQGRYSQSAERIALSAPWVQGLQEEIALAVGRDPHEMAGLLWKALRGEPE